MSVISNDIQAHWRMVRPLFSIRNDQEYDIAVDRLNALIDEIGTNEQHPLYDLLDTLGAVIQSYEDQHYPMPDCSGVDMLQFLMEEHQLTPSDLPEIGSSATISEILDGKRELTVKHLQVLATKFQVSPAVFV